MMRACHEVSLERAAKPASDSEGIKLGIEKYQRIKGILEAGNFPINTGEDSEPLCKRYNYVLQSGSMGGAIEVKKCVGCPIMEKTKQPKCLGTPWERFHTISLEVLENPSIFEAKAITLIELCNDEIAFLKKVRNVTADV